MEKLHYRDRRQLEEFVGQSRDAKLLRRAQALLWCDTGERVEAVGERLGVSRRTIYSWHLRFQERRGLAIRARLADGARSGRPCTALGIIDPLVEAGLAQDPRSLGYRATVWTAPLLQDYLQAAHGLRVSQPSVSLALDRLRLRWKRPRHQLALRSPTWRQAKGGSNAGCATGTARSC